MNPQYVYEGKFRQFRGYVFANGNPVTITDRGTQEAIAKDATFKRVDKIEERQAPVTTPTPVSAAHADECPKCGRIVKQGKYLHVKHCTGVTP